MQKFTPEYIEAQKQKKRAYMKKYLEKYYLEVLKPKRNKKSIQSNVINKPLSKDLTL
jgi:hypothetical protein